MKWPDPLCPALSRRATWQLLHDLNQRGMTMVLTTHYLDEAEALADQVAIMNEGTVARRGTVREIVRGHPATVAVDNLGAGAPSLPPLPGAAIDIGERLTIKTHHLQAHLFELLAWAQQHRLQLTGLDARHASLESVFLDIAAGRTGDPEDAHGRSTAASAPHTTGASR